jgi:hypothetical protein
MIESLIRELSRQQDTLGTIIPHELFSRYAEINEEIIEWLENYIKS